MVRTRRGSTSASDPEPHVELPANTRKGLCARQTTQFQPAPVTNGCSNGGAASAAPAVGAGVAVGGDVAAAVGGGAAVVVGGVEAVAIGGGAAGDIDSHEVVQTAPNQALNEIPLPEIGYEGTLPYTKRHFMKDILFMWSI